MKTLTMMLCAAAALVTTAHEAAAKLKVVATLSEYGWAADAIGGDLVETTVLCPPGQDPHFLSPRPSYAVAIGAADVLISTGLDLELWLNALLDKAGNSRVMPGQPAFVRAADGVPLLEVPVSVDRTLGDVHVYGNPHLNTSPMNVRIILHNVAVGLARVDATHAADYLAREKRVVAELDERVFGKELVAILGGDTLAKLMLKGKLWGFLAEKDYRGQKLSALLGGWYGRLSALVGRSIVAYHRNWAYLARDFALDATTTVEVKPGVAPTASHVAEVLRAIPAKRIGFVLATSYDNAQQIDTVASRGAIGKVVVPLHCGPEGYFALLDRWAAALEKELKKAP